MKKTIKKKSIDMKSILATGGVAIALLLLAYYLSPAPSDLSTPINVVRAYYDADKIFYSSGLGAERQNLKQLIAPRTWDCIEGQWEEAEQGIEHGSGESIGYNCGMNDLGYYQDPYPLTTVEFETISEDADTADIEVTFQNNNQVKLRYLLIQSDGAWRIIRGDRLGAEGDFSYSFPEDLEASILKTSGLQWDMREYENYFTPLADDVLSGASLFARSEDREFTEALAREFEKQGWKLGVTNDLHNGSLLTYERKTGDSNQYLIFSTEATFLTPEIPEQSPECPCIYTHQIFLGEE